MMQSIPAALFNFSRLIMVLSSSTRIGLSRISPVGKLSRDSKGFDSFQRDF